MEPDDIEDIYLEDDISIIPTEVLEHMYFVVWTELVKRGVDPERRGVH